MLMDGVMKLVQPKVVVEGTVKAGYPANSILWMGVALTIATVLYLIPITAVLGAILMTGYLGGAVATNVHGQTGLVMTFFPAILGALAWLGLLLRDHRLQKVLPLRR
jgi:hypothetical protein